MVGKQARLSKSRNADIGVMKVRPSNISSGESKGLLKVSSPPPPDETGPYEAFLERCHYCHRDLDLPQDLFMYGSLTAFCTAECRLAQMERDSANLERSESARKTCIKTRH